MAPRVMTVSGPIPPERVGFTLPHEHTGIFLWHVRDRWDYWELTPDELTLAEELRDFRRRGGSTLVDVTLPGIGRDPERLRRLTSRTGVQIVMGCGWYREAYYPVEALIDRRSVDDLAEELIGELRDGVGGSGVRPGIIGEIGTDKPWVSALEERVHRAAARAARATGLAITTHGVKSSVGLAQLRIFEEEGADPARVVIGHADSYPFLDHYLAILERGANLEFDFLGHRFSTEEAEEPRLVELIVELLERGYGSQLLLSQDVCHNSQLKANGGSGYTYLQQHFLPTLRTAAVGEGEIQQMTIDNPRRILTVA
ncbi:MAG TPA: phosphotriesterase-related protein [Candidatus Dormibacteraeota bacterium]|nr:phosphotriesterase-related protein [Candidatus Dormibacteraeota bacterium]